MFLSRTSMCDSNKISNEALNVRTWLYYAVLYFMKIVYSVCFHSFSKRPLILASAINNCLFHVWIWWWFCPLIRMSRTYSILFIRNTFSTLPSFLLNESCTTKFIASWFHLISLHVHCMYRASHRDKDLDDKRSVNRNALFVIFATWLIRFTMNY